MTMLTWTLEHTAADEPLIRRVRLAYRAAMIDRMLTFDSNGLIPAIVQDAITGRVLMLGWMNEEALRRTRESGEVWFWSRSRSELWHKGATSGNILRVRELRTDCDADAILVRAEPAGPTCHTGRESCFFRVWDERSERFLEPEDAPSAHRAERLVDDPPRSSFLDQLEGIVKSRRASTPDGSYTASLLHKGRFKIAQKVGEEGLEAAMAGVAQDDDRVIDESADLLFHLLVLLNERDIELRDVLERLDERHNERGNSSTNRRE